MRIITMTREHSPEVLALIQAVEHEKRYNLDWLRYRTLADETCPPDLLLLAESQGKIVGYCFGCLRGDRGVIKLFGVSEDHRRQGIATALLAEIEARVRARNLPMLTAEGAAPEHFVPGVEITRTEAVSFLLHRGFETDRIARVDMAVDLACADLCTDETEAALASQGITVRRAAPGDVGAAAAFALENFSANWQHEVATTVRFSPLPLFIACDGERVISFAAYDVGGPALFGPTGTHPDYRRKGIGGVLLKLCMRSMRDRGERLAGISWVGPIGFYACAVGARIHRAYWLFRKKLA